MKKAIEDMAACGLRCVANAYRSYEMEKVPSSEQLEQWALPEDDLVLLAVVGIKVYVPMETSFIYCRMWLLDHGNDLLCASFP